MRHLPLHVTQRRLRYLTLYMWPQADVARTSLAACAQLLQTPLVWDTSEPIGDLRLPNAHGEPCGPSAKGEGALYRWYETGEGEWIFVAAHPDSAESAKVLAALTVSTSPPDLTLPALRGRDLGRLDDDELTLTLAAAICQASVVTAVTAVIAVTVVSAGRGNLPGEPHCPFHGLTRPHTALRSAS